MISSRGDLLPCIARLCSSRFPQGLCDSSRRYNDLLRGFGAHKDCKGNTYVTTTHAINSCIVKNSKLTKAMKVFRGVSGGMLPKSFWEANDQGVRGGIEAAFMSTTHDRNVAMQYASGEEGKPAKPALVLEMQMGMIDRGADISWLSQYPHEAEILFNPLTGLEVQSTRVDGAVMVVVVKPSVNLTSMTLEQVIGKRKKMLVDMLPGLRSELRTKLSAEELLNGEGITFLLERLEPRCKGGPLRHEEAWYNEDEQLKQALDEMLAMRRGLGPGGSVRIEELKVVPPAEDGKTYGAPAAAFTGQVEEALRGLGDPNASVRTTAVKAFGELDAVVFTMYAGALVTMLEDLDVGVRYAVVQTLGKLDVAVLAQHQRQSAIKSMLQDSEPYVREAAEKVCSGKGW